MGFDQQALAKLGGKAKFDEDRRRFMNDALNADDGGWTVHTAYHWSRTLDGKRLDYWPSRKKFQYEGRVMRGDVYWFIKNNKQAVQPELVLPKLPVELTQPPSTGSELDPPF